MRYSTKVRATTRRRELFRTGLWILLSVSSCLVAGRAAWGRVAERIAAMTSEQAAAPVANGQPGNVEVDAVLEKHWSAWNGQYALFVRPAIAVRTAQDFAHLHLLIPAFEYGKESAREGQKLRENAMSFARDAGMEIEEEARFEFYRARFLSDPAAVAFMPDAMAKALAFDTAIGIQRLALVRSSMD